MKEPDLPKPDMSRIPELRLVRDGDARHEHVWHLLRDGKPIAVIFDKRDDYILDGVRMGRINIQDEDFYGINDLLAAEDLARQAFPQSSINWGEALYLGALRHLLGWWIDDLNGKKQHDSKTVDSQGVTHEADKAV